MVMIQRKFPVKLSVILATIGGAVISGFAVKSRALAAEPATAADWAGFQKTVQPFLVQHCNKCHGDVDPQADIQLTAFRDDKSLSRGSETFEKMIEMLESKKMPPADEPQPGEAEIAPVLGWLHDYTTINCEGPRYPGRVTMRRLNRAEYNNTIRDLLAMDFKPADSFPVDDAGYGFDNIGDVLSMAPVLMEKYLTASSQVLDKAIFSEPSIPPTLKRFDGATAEGTIPKNDPKLAMDGGEFARNMFNGRVFQTAGEIYADYNFPADGTYVLRVRGYGTQGSATRARPFVELRIDGQPVQQPINIKEDQRNTSVYSLEPMRLTGGQHRVSLAFTNGATAAEVAAVAASIAALPPATAPSTAPTEINVNAVAVAAEAATPVAAPAAGAIPQVAGVTPATAPTSAPFNARGRGGAAAAGARGRGGAGARGGAPAGPTTGKPTLGIVYFEVEGPTEVTPDRMPESYRRVMVAQPSASLPKEQAAEQIIRNFTAKAYRRPLLDGEVSRLLSLWKEIDASGDSFERSIHDTLEVVLASPYFLYRIEKDPATNDPDGVRTLDEYELATRLSYFLWSSMPDDELFSLAAKGQLRANLEAQIQRMIKDPKSSALVENFAGQWLQLRQMSNVAPDTKKFPDFDDALRSAMIKETQMFFGAIVHEDRSVLDLIDADYTYVNERLARHYGIKGITGDEFRRISLPPALRGGGGLLTQASILTITSYPNRTSPVQRGKWVLENLLDSPPPPPPPDVPKLAETEQAELTGTVRQRMEQHRANPACASCHARMDPIGFGLENFDAIGAWRTQDTNSQPIDTSGALPDGKSFNGPAELKQILKDKQDQFCRCMADKLLTFALGRGLESYDRCTVDEIVTATKGHDYKFSTMVSEIVKSDPFQKRGVKRGE